MIFNKLNIKLIVISFKQLTLNFAMFSFDNCFCCTNKKVTYEVTIYQLRLRHPLNFNCSGKTYNRTQLIRDGA